MQGDTAMKYLFGLIVLVVLVLVCFPVGCVNVASTDVAVCVDKFANKVDSEPYGVGYHFYNRWKTDMPTYVVSTRAFPENVQGSEESKQYTMELKTADGQNVNVDMTLQVALRSKEVPSLHQKIGHNYENEVLLPQMRSEARLAFGAYTAEDIYQGKVREEIQRQVLKKLTDSLSKTNTVGELLYPAIQVSDVLVRHLSFSPAFEAAIESKKLAAQQVEVNKQLALAQEQKALQVEAEARGQKLKAVQEGTAKGEAAEAEATGKAKAIKIAADAEQYKLEAEAKGNLARYKAEAEGKRLAAEALAGPGGQSVVNLEWAKNIPPTMQTYAYPAGASISVIGGSLQDALPKMFSAPATVPTGK
jgi:regulator of protease activity HflC (stomatin/prohibitin superfamily)